MQIWGTLAQPAAVELTSLLALSHLLGQGQALGVEILLK